MEAKIFGVWQGRAKNHQVLWTWQKNSGKGGGHGEDDEVFVAAHNSFGASERSTSSELLRKANKKKTKSYEYIVTTMT